MNGLKGGPRQWHAQRPRALHCLECAGRRFGLGVLLGLCQHGPPLAATAHDTWPQVDWHLARFLLFPFCLHLHIGLLSLDFARFLILGFRPIHPSTSIH